MGTWSQLWKNLTLGPSFWTANPPKSIQKKPWIPIVFGRKFGSTLPEESHTQGCRRACRWRNSSYSWNERPLAMEISWNFTQCLTVFWTKHRRGLDTVTFIWTRICIILPDFRNVWHWFILTIILWVSWIWEGLGEAAVTTMRTYHYDLTDLDVKNRSVWRIICVYMQLSILGMFAKARVDQNQVSAVE